MRVISGRARGSSLYALDGMNTRPTADRVKEAMFSIIAPYVPGCRVLDLFAGSGALGIEALSRGAAGCVFVESSVSALSVVKKNLEKTKLSECAEVLKSDYKAFLNSASGGFDIILLDPPYNRQMCDAALGIIFEKNLLADGGVIVCETEYGEQISTAFNVRKEYKYGKTKLTLLDRDG